MKARKTDDARGVAADVAACLKGAPSGDCTTDQVKDWLFNRPNPVAERVRQILKDKAARALLTEAAGRTWGQVTDPEGGAQRLWRTLGTELRRLAEQGGGNLDCTIPAEVAGIPKSFLPCSARELAGKAADLCAEPLAAKADLVLPERPPLRPYDEPVREWVKINGENVYAVPVPPLGDFVAPLVLRRLGMMADLLFRLSREATGERLPTSAKAAHEGYLEVRREIHDVPDADERGHALTLLQVYLAGGWFRNEAVDWSVIGWPYVGAEPAPLIAESLAEAEAHVKPLGRAHFTVEALHLWTETMLAYRPAKVRNIVAASLEWLGGKVSEAPQSRSKEQPWADDAPGYVTLKEAHKFIDARVSLPTLSKLCKPDGEVRYMRNYGKSGRATRCKVYCDDFRRYMKSRQNDPQWAKAYVDFREAVGKGDRRWFWRCKSCGHEYPENAKAPERCPKCKGEVELTPKAPPKPRR